MQTSGPSLPPARPAATPARAGIVPATRYTRLPDVRVVRKQESMVDWLHRELKEGNQLAEYLRLEKGSGLQRRRTLAARHQHFEQNKKSDLRLRAVLPAREFMRLRLMDPHFFEDETNLRNLIRDNPEIAPWRKK